MRETKYDLRQRYHAFYRLKRFIPKREEQELIWQHHREVYDALRARAPERARDAIIAHMDFVEQRLAESVDSLLGTKTQLLRKRPYCRPSYTITGDMTSA